MNWEIRLALSLMLLLCLLALQACNQVPVIEKIEQQHEPQDNELSSTGPTNFEGIANALGCVFAPNTCDSSK